jgi:hypothetical protein
MFYDYGTKVSKQGMEFESENDYCMFHKRYKLFNVQVNTTEDRFINQNKVSKFSILN